MWELGMGLLFMASFFFFVGIMDLYNERRAKRYKKSYHKVATSARRYNFRDPRY